MIKTEVREGAKKTERNRKRNVDDDDDNSVQVSTKSAKVVNEKKTAAKQRNRSEHRVKKVKNGELQAEKKLKPTQKTMRTDGNKKKPKMVRILVKIVKNGINCCKLNAYMSIYVSKKSR